jgi:hypothetical protein
MKLIGVLGPENLYFTIGVFRDATSCRLINIWWRFEVTYCFHLRGETDEDGFNFRSDTRR